MPRLSGGGAHAALLALHAAAFAPLLRTPRAFVPWDDPENFVEEHGWKGLRWRHVRWALSSQQAAVYEPVAWLVKGAQFEAFGLRPGGFIAVTVALHTAACALLLHTLLLLQRQPAQDVDALPALLAVASFGVHPLRVEVVAWASAQPYATAAAAAAAALHCHARALCGGADNRAHSARWRAAAVACYLAAAFSKATAAPLAAAHLALEAARGGGGGGASGLRMLAALAAAAALAVAGAAYGNASHVEVAPPRHNEGAGLAAHQRVAAAAAAAVSAAVRSVSPRGLAPRYPLPDSISPLDAPHAAALAIVACLAAAGVAVLAARLPRWRAAFFGGAAAAAYVPAPAPLPAALTLVALALFPTCGVLKHGYDNAGADRYSLFPAALLVPFVAQAVHSALSRPPLLLQRGAACFACAGVCALAACAAAQTNTWADGASFAARELAVAVGPRAVADAANDLLLRLHGAGRHAEALSFSFSTAALAAAPGHLSMALTASAAAAALQQPQRGLDALAGALVVHGGREAAVHHNAAQLAAAACRLRDAAAHVAAAEALAPRAPPGAAAAKRLREARRSCAADAADSDAFRTLLGMRDPVLVSWPVGGASGWGTLSRALLGALMAREATPLLLHAPPAESQAMFEAFSTAQLAQLRAGHDALVAALKAAGAASAADADVAAEVFGFDPAICAPLRLPLPALHGLGNGLRGSDAVAAATAGTSTGCLRLQGSPNVAIAFFEDVKAGLAPRQLARRAAHFSSLVAGSTWTQGVLRDALAALPAGADGAAHKNATASVSLPRVALALQGVDGAAFPARSAAPPPSAPNVPFVVFSGGKLEARKGQDVVVSAFRLFRTAHPEAALLAAWHSEYAADGAHLAAAGHVSAPPGGAFTGVPPGALAAWLAANGVPRGAATAVRAAAAAADVAAALGRAHVALFPARAESGTNLFAVQALATGVPTILSAGTGHDDLLAACAPPLCRGLTAGARDEATGWTEPDAAEAAHALELVWRDYQRGNVDAAALQQQARHVAQRFSWDAWFANVSAELRLP